MNAVAAPVAVTDAWEGELVVFLIGMRINAWWRPDLWFPIVRSMGRMLRDLRERPELGFLGAMPTGLSNPLVFVHYWKSVDHLHKFASAREHPHLEAWADFNRRARASTAVGIWHETFVVPPGAHETIYVNMPPFGLSAATGCRPVASQKTTAR